MGVRQIPNRWLNVSALLLVCVAALLVLWLLELRRRRDAERGWRAAAAISTAVADGGLRLGPATRGRITSVSLNACRDPRPDSVRALGGLVAEFAPGYGVLTSPEQFAVAKTFLSQNSELREQFLSSVDRAREAEREGRDTGRVRAQLRGVLLAAASGSEPAVRQTLLYVESSLVSAPFQNASFSAVEASAGVSASTRARAVLLECAHPLEVLSGVLAEGAQAIGKLTLLARHRLSAGDGEQALWLAETCAHLLGLRPLGGAEEVAELPPALVPAALPATAAAVTQRLLDTCEALMKGRQAAGREVFPAEQLLVDARRRFDTGQVRESAVLARAGLNILGMDDHAIRDLLAATDQ